MRAHQIATLNFLGVLQATVIFLEMVEEQKAREAPLIVNRQD